VFTGVGVPGTGVNVAAATVPVGLGDAVGLAVAVGVGLAVAVAVGLAVGVSVGLAVGVGAGVTNVLVIVQEGVPPTVMATPAHPAWLAV
jgi:hypothetical protein